MTLFAIRENHFRLRLCEWVLAVIMMLFGVMLYHSDVAQITRFFGRLFEMWPPRTLAVVMSSIGMARFAALLVNGLWVRTPFVRAVMAMFSGIFWALITEALLTSGVVGTGWAVYPVFTALEFLNMYYAAQDARVAQERLAAAKGV